MFTKIQGNHKAMRRSNKQNENEVDNNKNMFKYLEEGTTQDPFEEPQTKLEDMEMCRKSDLNSQTGGTKEGELEMKDSKEHEEARAENNEEETAHEMDLKKVEIYIQVLKELHGEKEVNDMTIGQL